MEIIYFDTNLKLQKDDKNYLINDKIVTKNEFDTTYKTILMQNQMYINLLKKYNYKLN